MAGALLAVGLVLYNNLLNRWARFHRAPYVPLNLALAAALIALALGPLGLDAAAIGLGGEPGAAAIWGAAGLGFTLPLYLGAATRRGAALLADRRLADAGPRQLLYRVLVRVPLGTALVEEVAFRGVLLAVWRPSGAVAAAVLASAAFGLWHVAPTLHLVRSNRPGSGIGPSLGAVAGAILVTTAAGFVLALLRLETAGLAAPFALHAALNSGATGAAYRARRRTLSVPGDRL